MTVSETPTTIQTSDAGPSSSRLAAYERAGYFIARQLLTPAEVAEIRDAFMAQGANGPVEGLSEIHGYKPTDPLARYPRMMHPHRHPELPVGPLALRYLLDARIREVLADLLQDEPIAAQSMFYFKPPGARGQDLHQDNFYLRVHPGSCMAAWAAIDDADEANGTLVVVPGSHKMEIVCPQQANSERFFTSEHVDVPAGMQEIPVLLRAGDVLFFNGSLIHGSYPNTSPDRFRRALICHYVPRRCTEVAHWYSPLLDFRGQIVERAVATGGGPCGTATEAAKGPH
jgi:ectoine hydroxylase-related dioxygenase (phytanoyl-CoA dioxygenase family)